MRPRVAWISLRLRSFLSLSPSTRPMIKLRAFALRSFSGRVHRTCPVKWTNTLISCLFGSLILTLSVAKRSFVVFPNETLPPWSIRAERLYAASLRFCQLPLSFILGMSFKTSFDKSLSLPSDLDYIFLLGMTLHSRAASPSNSIRGFFWSSVSCLVFLNSPSIPFIVASSSWAFKPSPRLA